MGKRKDGGLLMNAFRTMIVTAADAPLARQLASAIDPGSSSDMWITPLAPSADAITPTHYISTGWVSETFATPLPLAEWTYEATGDADETWIWVRTGYLPGNPAAVVAAAAALDPPIEVTEAEVEALFVASDVTTEDPWVALGRLGLVIVQTPEAENGDD